MKNALRLLAVTLIALAASAQTQTTYTVTLTGYQTKDYSIGPAMSQKLITQVVDPVQSALKSSPEDKVSIAIAGYADHTGTSGENSYYGDERAAAVRQFLVPRLPSKVTLGNYPVGDKDQNLNERAVVITVTITPGVALPTPKNEPVSWTVVIVIAGISALMTLTITFLSFRKRKNIVKVVEVERNREIICVPIEKQSPTRFVLPFEAPNDVRDNLQDATRAAKNGIKDPKHGASDAKLQELVQKKKVWVKKIGEIG